MFKDKIVAVITDTAATAAKEAINQSELDADDKKVINEQIDRVAKAYRDGELSNEQVQQLANKIVDSPLIVAGMVFVIEQRFVEKSGLSEEEKTAAHRTLERTARGLYEEKISRQELDKVMPYIATRSGEDDWNLKQQVSDEDLRAFLAECKQLADKANIPDEPFEVNIGEEVKKAVDEVLPE